jgi:hypothetical protein
VGVLEVNAIMHTHIKDIDEIISNSFILKRALNKQKEIVKITD